MEGRLLLDINALWDMEGRSDNALWDMEGRSSLISTPSGTWKGGLTTPSGDMEGRLLLDINALWDIRGR